MSKQDYVPTLFNLFRQYGYEGVTLAKIAQATGLGKASLYHHFPGGKAEMAEMALAQANLWLETRVIVLLASEASPLEKFRAMAEAVNQGYGEGHQSCLLAALVLAPASEDLFPAQIHAVFVRWIQAIATVLSTAGLNETLANQRAEDALIAIQGALILSRGLGEIAPFQRIIQQLPAQLCQDIGG